MTEEGAERRADKSRQGRRQGRRAGGGRPRPPVGGSAGPGREPSCGCGTVGRPGQ